MKPQRPSRFRSACPRAQISDKLLAYSAATAATLVAASVAKALPPGGTPLDAAYFGGSLPSLSFSTTDDFTDSIGFSIGNGDVQFWGSHYFSSSTTYSSDFFSGYFSIANSGGFLSLNLNGSSFVIEGSRSVFRTSSGIEVDNRFGSSYAHSASLNFVTNSGGYGYLPLQLFWDGSGDISISVASGGMFYSAIPEPANLAAGLGLLALGYAGIREHRRRRAAAKLVAAD